MDTQTEPNEAAIDEAIDSTIDSKLDEIEAGTSTPQESSPEKVETGDKEASGTEPPKPEEATEESEEDLPKGFADHPKWKKLMSERNEAREAKEQAESSLKSHEEIFNDPDIYRKSLVRKGLSEFEIDAKMTDRGFPTAEKVSTPMFERVAKNLGWDTARLNQSQKDQINDIIRVSEATANEIIGEKLKPIQESMSQSRAKTVVDDEFTSVQTLAKEEGIDWKLAEKAMEATLNQLDRSAGHKVKIGPMALYEKATRKILLEKQVTKDSKETRDAKKANARPLTPNARTSKTPEKVSMKSDSDVDNMVDKYLDDMGYKE